MSDLQLRPGAGDLERLMLRVRTQEIPDGPFAGRRPLARASLEGPGNWLLALLEAWAQVGQVIDFYGERIRDEGYLSTAVQELSVYELIRLLGYPPRPGVAAATWVAYSVGGGSEVPEQIEVPRGARIQSAPIGDQLPQSFELVSALVARGEWSAMAPAVPTVSAAVPVAADATAVTLAGALTSLKPGAPLLVTGVDDGTPRQFFRLAQKAQTIAAGGASGARGPVTVATWQEPLDPAGAGRTLARPEVFSLPGRERLFGYNALPWDDLPLPEKRKQRQILGGVLISTDRGGSWQGVDSGMPAVPVNALIYASGSLLAATRQGLYALDSGAWQLRAQGLGKASVQSLALSPSGHLFAGAADGRVLRSTDAGDSWETLVGSPSQSRRDPAADLLPPRFRPPPRLMHLPRAPVRALAVAPDGALIASGDSGVFVSHNADGVWEPCNRGLPGTDPTTGLAGLSVPALAVDDRGALYAGTEKGVYRARRAGAEWRPASDGLPGWQAASGTAGVKVLALLAWLDRRRRQRYLFAGTDRGIYRRTGDGSWRSANVGLPGTDPLARTAAVTVQALALGSDPSTLSPWLWAGTAQGPYRSADLGGGWLPLPTGQPTAPVSALAADGSTVAAATPFDGFAVEEWPGFHLVNGTVDLAKVDSEAVPGGWAVLMATATPGSAEPGAPAGGQGGSGPTSGAASGGTPSGGTASGGTGATGAAPAATSEVAILPILDATVVRRTAFNRSDLVTRLTVPADVDLRRFSLRDTVVLLDSRRLPLVVASVPLLMPIGPLRIALATPLVRPLPPQRPLMVTGRPIRARLPAGALAKGAGGALGPLDPAGATVTVLTSPRAAEPPKSAGRAGAASSGVWLSMTVRIAGGEEPTVITPVEGLVWLAAESDADSIGELAWVAGTEPGQDAIVLLSPLTRAYDPQTVRLQGNVAQAVQGETVAQVLGNGDSRRPNQSFSLTNVPLTYEPAGTAAGLRATLQVRVDGVLWQELSSFRGAGPETRGYVVHRDLSGRPLVHFGDGVHGARLPTGTGNVRAVYRAGLWTTPLAAGQLSLPRTRPLGVRGVTNPLPTPGATPAETLGELRRRAPRSTRPLARIVSLTDFEDFVLTYPGISRAYLAELATPGGALLQVTVAGIDGAPVDPDGELYRNLVAAVEAVRLPGRRLIVGSYRPLVWRLSARLRPDPAEVAANVVQRVRSALSSAYGFDQARFGQVLASSQVLTLIQEVPGVVAAELTAFYPAGEPPRLEDTLRARRAHWAGGEAVAAELLLLDEPSGVTLIADRPAPVRRSA